MSLGQMDRLVTIQRGTASKDATSKAPKMVWTTLGTAFMAVRPNVVSGRRGERFVAEQLSASVETVWHTHFREDMDPEAIDVPKFRRLSFRGRTHEIVRASHLGMREGIEIVTIANAKVTS